MDDEENSFQEGLEKESQENKSKNFILDFIVIAFVVFIVIGFVRNRFVGNESYNENETLLNVSEEYAEVARDFEDCLHYISFFERKECIEKIKITDEAKNVIFLEVEEHCNTLINKNKNFSQGSLEFCIFIYEILFDEQFDCSSLEYPDNEAYCNAMLNKNPEECSKIINQKLRLICLSEFDY